MKVPGNVSEKGANESVHQHFYNCGHKADVFQECVLCVVVVGLYCYPPPPWQIWWRLVC